MTFAEFYDKSFPGKSVFERREFDFLTNLIRWLALHAAYVFFKCRFSANFLDVIGIPFALGGFLLVSTALQGHTSLPILGILMIYAHVFLDFADGPIARAQGVSAPLGHLLDEIGGAIDRFALIILFGVFTGSTFLILMNVFAAGTFQLMIFRVKDELPTVGIPGLFKKIYINKYSFLSIRFTLMILPFIVGVAIVGGWDLRRLGLVFSIFYATTASLWLLMCIPNYKIGKES